MYIILFLLPRATRGRKSIDRQKHSMILSRRRPFLPRAKQWTSFPREQTFSYSPNLLPIRIWAIERLLQTSVFDVVRTRLKISFTLGDKWTKKNGQNSVKFKLKIIKMYLHFVDVKNWNRAYVLQNLRLYAEHKYLEIFNRRSLSKKSINKSRLPDISATFFALSLLTTVSFECKFDFV